MIDAIDEDAYRWLDAGIVRTITETADEKVGVTRTLQLPDAQRGHQELQVLDIRYLRLFQLVGPYNRNSDRYLLQCSCSVCSRFAEVTTISSRGPCSCADAGNAVAATARPRALKSKFLKFIVSPYSGHLQVPGVKYSSAGVQTAKTGEATTNRKSHRVELVRALPGLIRCVYEYMRFASSLRARKCFVETPSLSKHWRPACRGKYTNVLSNTGMIEIVAS
jgi:hypothetical protein